MEGIDKHALDERLFLEEFGESKSPVGESLEDLAVKYHHAILHADQVKNELFWQFYYFFAIP